MENGQRMTYPRLAGELIGSINALLSGGPTVLRDGEAACAIVPAPAPGGYEPCLSLRVRVGGSALRVHLDAGAVEAALGPLVPPSSFAALDEDLKLAVLEFALAEPLAALGGLVRAEFLLEGIEEEPDGRSESETAGGSRGCPADSNPAPPGSLLFEVRLPPDVVRCAVLVDLLAPLPGAIIEKLVAARGRRTADYDSLPVPVSIELGTASLSAADFRTLEAGDIVLFDECYIVDDRVRVNVCDSVVWFGSVNGVELTLLAAPVHDMGRDTNERTG